MWQHVTVAWRSGLRSRSFHALFVLGLLAVSGAYLAAQFSARQPATVALDVCISCVRFIALLMMIFWCQELVAREVERRTVFLALTYPVPRSSYLLGRYIGVVMLAAAAIGILGLMTLSSAYLAGSEYLQATPINLRGGLALTLLCILVDVAVVGAVTMLITTISTTPLLPLALGAAFAIAARGWGQAMDLLRDKTGGPADLEGALRPALDAMRWVLPDLGRLDVRAAALYDQWPAGPALLWSVATSLAYIVVVLAFSVLVFRRRQFD